MFHPMQRQHQYPNHAKKKNPAVKPQIKSKNPPPIVIIPKSADDDRSSVCSIGAFHLRRAAEEEELRLREELEMEIERELEQELIDGISELVRRLSDLKARQIARGLVKVNDVRVTKKAEVDVAGATRRWVATSFPQRDRAADFGEESGYDSGCSDAESTRKNYYILRPDVKEHLVLGKNAPILRCTNSVHLGIGAFLP